MITGRVTAELEGIIELEVSGFGAAPQQVEAVIDTGFNGYLTLPNRVIGPLNLHPEGGAVVGMSLLHGSRLSMEVLDDGDAAIEELVSSTHP